MTGHFIRATHPGSVFFKQGQQIDAHLWVIKQFRKSYSENITVKTNENGIINEKNARKR